MAGEGKTLGLYGFGAAAHILAQVAIWQGRRVFAFTRKGDTAAQDFARSLGVVWAGGSEQAPPERLDAAIIFAPVGALVPAAQGRARGLRRHPHVRHSELSLFIAVGGTARDVSGEPHAHRRA
jgi:propanol-preferring alcohol dehydrogenase